MKKAVTNTNNGGNAPAMTLEQAREIVAGYKKVLTTMKQNGVKMEDIPAEFEQPLLHMHQLALLVYMVDKGQGTWEKLYATKDALCQ